MKTVLLSTAYLPPLHYFYYLLNAEKIIIETQEHFVKQTYRNRCEILSANGKLSLSIPLLKSADKTLISKKQISYSENWQKVHWRAITSAYKNTPYFEYFENDFKPFYENKFEFLFDYNLQLTQTIFKILRKKKEISFTKTFEKETGLFDLRETVHPKNNSIKIEALVVPYRQAFSDKLGFTKNLSVIDLLFNKGLETKDFLAVKQ